jgi:cytochrome c oxidase subunit 1
VLSLGAVFSLFAGWYYWFGKMWGRNYNELLGQLHFWVFFVGVNILFMPMHFLGMDGMQRRVPDYPEAFAGWHGWATTGYIIMAVGMIFFFVNIFWSLLFGKKTPPNPGAKARRRSSGPSRARRPSTSSRPCRRWIDNAPSRPGGRA